MTKNKSAKFLLSAFTFSLLLASTPSYAGIITGLVKTGGDIVSPDPVIVTAGLVPGALSYVDRTATWNVIPGYLLAADYIQTENDDKNVAGEQYAVTLGANGFLHIFVDQRLGAPSAINQLTWLTNGTVVAGNFAKSGGILLQGFAPFGDFNFDVWSAPVTAGTYNLGEQSGASFYGIAATPARVPEPGSTMLLLGIGLVGLRAWRKRVG